MHETAHRLRATLRTLADPSALLIGAMALLTIGLAIVIDVSGLTPTTPAFGTRIDYATAPLQHALTLVLSTVLITSGAYSFRADPDRSLTDLVGVVIIGLIAGALLSVFLSGSGPFHQMRRTLTLRPQFTAVAVLIGLGYYGGLHTRYDWVVIDLIGMVLLPFAMVQFASYALPLLAGGLVVTAAVDYIAVHRSDAMESMAMNLLAGRFPVAFVVPVTATSLADAVERDDDGAWLTGIRLFGFGDVVIPGTFVVAVVVQSPAFLPIPAVTALLGYAIAYSIIIADPFDKVAYAGLPFLNAGVLIGTGIGFLIG